MAKTVSVALKTSSDSVSTRLKDDLKSQSESSFR